MKNTVVDIVFNPDSTAFTTKQNQEKLVIVNIVLNKSKNINFNLYPSCNSQLFVIVAVSLSKKARLKLSTTQEHYEKHSTTDFLCKTVLKDVSSFEYTGTITISPKGQHSHAYQRNENLLVTDNVSVVSEPKLEIEANEVFCTHGATSSYIPSDQKFYLKSRGLRDNEAESLISKGFLYSIADKCIEYGLSQKQVQKIINLIGKAHFNE